MLAYQFKDNLIYKLHPLTSMIFVGVVFVLALIFSHPAFLLGLLIPVGVVLGAAGNLMQGRNYIKFSLIMVLTIVLINVRQGTSCIGLGQSHCSLPFTGKHLFQIQVFLFLGTMVNYQISGTAGKGYVST
jgi:energy-coupling factor transporter transmembrane protein EcfT